MKRGSGGDVEWWIDGGEEVREGQKRRGREVGEEERRRGWEVKRWNGGEEVGGEEKKRGEE